MRDRTRTAPERQPRWSAGQAESEPAQRGAAPGSSSLAALVAGRGLDPERYFIIIPDMSGNGLSSSPGNVGPPHDRGRFPGVTVADTVRMQHRLLSEQLGIERVAE